MKKIPKILITPGDPSGIGFDILLEISKKKFPSFFIILLLPFPRKTKYDYTSSHVQYLSKIEIVEDKNNNKS